MQQQSGHVRPSAAPPTWQYIPPQSEPPAQGSKQPKTPTPRRQLLWYLLSFALGVLLTVAVVAIVISGILGGSARSALASLGIDAEDILSEEYLDRPALEVMNEVLADLQALSDPDSVSLATLSKYSPAVEEIAETMSVQFAELGVRMDSDTLLSTPLGSLGELLQESVRGAELGTALGINSLSDPILIELCYGQAGEDYVIINGRIVMNAGKRATTVGDLTDGATSLLQELYVETAFGVSASSNETLRFLAYGREGEQYVIENGAVRMLSDPVTGIAYEKRTLGDLADNSIYDGVTIDYGGTQTALADLPVGAAADTALLSALADEPLCALPAALGTLTLAQVLPESALFAPVQDTALEALSDDTLSALTVGSLCETPLPEALAAAPLSDWADALNALPLADLLGEEAMESRVLHALEGATFGELPARIAALTVFDVFGDVMYSYCAPALNGGRGYAEMIASYEPASDPATGAPGSLRPALLTTDDLAVSEQNDRLIATWTQEGERCTAEVERCLTGTWYLLLGEEADVPLSALAGAIRAADDALHEMPLWELYLHGVIDENPYAVLPEAYPADGIIYENLNEFTLEGLLGYTKYLLTALS